MDEIPTPTITSFVIRFIQTGSSERQSYRGSILHVQTNQEAAFSHWEDAVAFIQRFVDLAEGEESQPKVPPCD